MCSIYQNYKNDIDKCVSTDSVTISGVINLFKLICDIKINSIAKNTECLHDMETRLKSACRISCLEKILGVGAPQIYELIDSDEDKFPQKCRGLIRKSLEVTIRASEHEIPKVHEEIGLEKESGRPF
uniref:Uncharacterized protein n=1 Tax=Acrobeloides nanus TaxID=290746 RepID=A0A914CSP6_9BILA